MSKVKLVGTIVPSIYDAVGLNEYIDKGIICPESHFIRQVESAAKDEPMEIYVNSPGGSVFSGYEMQNAVTRWIRETGQSVSVLVGGMCASAASAFVVMLGAATTAHANSKFMFHGATVGTWGGTDGLKDTAAVIDKIDGEIKTALVGKGIDAATVDQWFAEGRMGWLSAEEAKTHGIVSEVLDGMGEPIRIADIDLVALSQGGLSIAALFDVASLKSEGDTEDPDATDEEPTEDPQADPETEPDPAEDDAEPPLAEQLVAKQQEVEDLTGKLKAAVDMNVEQAKTIQERDKTIKSMNAGLDKKQAALDKATNELDQAKIYLARVAPKRENDPATDVLDGAMDWQEAQKKCGGDYVKARQKFPKSYKAFMAKEKR